MMSCCRSYANLIYLLTEIDQENTGQLNLSGQTVLILVYPVAGALTW